MFFFLRFDHVITIPNIQTVFSGESIHEAYIHDESPVPNLTSLQIFLSSIFFLWTEDEYLFLDEEVIDSPLQPNPENF